MSEPWARRPPSLEARLALVLQALDEAQRGVNELIAEIRTEQVEGDSGDRRDAPRRDSDPGHPGRGAAGPG